jgi:hypothetical protein
VDSENLNFFDNIYQQYLVEIVRLISFYKSMVIYFSSFHCHK